MPVSARNCSGRSCGSVVTIEPFPDPPPRDLERRRALATRRGLREQPTRPPATTPPVAGAEIGEPVRVLASPPRTSRRGTRRGSARSCWTTTTATAATPTTATSHAQRARQRAPPLVGSARSRRAEVREHADRRAAPTQSKTPNQAPSFTRSPYGCRSSVSAGRENAQSATSAGDRRDEDERARPRGGSRVDRQPGERRERGDGDPAARVGEDDDQLGEVDEQGARWPGRPDETAGSRPPTDRTAPRWRRRARASSSSRPGCAAWRRGRRRGRATGSPCRAGPRPARGRPARPARRRRSAPAAARGRRAGRAGRSPRRRAAGRTPSRIGRARSTTTSSARPRRSGRRAAPGQPPRRREAPAAAAGGDRGGGEHRQRADPEQPAVRGPVAEEQRGEEQRGRGDEGRATGEHGGLHRRPTLAGP